MYLASDYGFAVAPFLISQCYNFKGVCFCSEAAVAPFLISQCYNSSFNVL